VGGYRVPIEGVFTPPCLGGVCKNITGRRQKRGRVHKDNDPKKQEKSIQASEQPTLSLPPLGLSPFRWNMGNNACSVMGSRLLLTNASTGTAGSQTGTGWLARVLTQSPMIYVRPRLAPLRHRSFARLQGVAAWLGLYNSLGGAAQCRGQSRRTTSSELITSSLHVIKTEIRLGPITLRSLLISLYIIIAYDDRLTIRWQVLCFILAQRQAYFLPEMAQVSWTTVYNR